MDMRIWISFSYLDINGYVNVDMCWITFPYLYINGYVDKSWVCKNKSKICECE